MPRSVGADALKDTDAKFHKAVDDAVQEENARWGKPGTITVNNELVGDRPVGSLPADAPLVRTAAAVTKLFGTFSMEGAGSSDANWPLSLGVPSISMGGGGRGTEAHSLNEAFDTTDSHLGTQRATLLTIALAQK